MQSKSVTFLISILALCGATGARRADDIDHADVLAGSACVAANRKAIEWIAGERPGQAAAMLNELLVQRGDTLNNLHCRCVTLTNLANAMVRAGRLDEAVRSATEAVDLAGRDDQASSALLYGPKLILAQVAVSQRHGSQALRLLYELDSIPGAAARDLAVRFGLEAVVVAGSGDFKRAETLARRSVEHWQLAGLFDSLDAVTDRTNLAVIHLRRGRTREATSEIEDCVRVLDRNPRSPILATSTLLTAAGVLRSRAPRAAEDMLSRVMRLLPDLPEPIRREDEFLTYRLQELVFRKMHQREEAQQAHRRLQAMGTDGAALTVDLSDLKGALRKAPR
jgi:tetratricopeptide (TPR) repeat protein